MSLLQAERTKLTANFLNAIASGTVVASLVAPFISMALGTVQPAVDTLTVLALSALHWCSRSCHIYWRRVLVNLED